MSRRAPLRWVAAVALAACLATAGPAGAQTATTSFTGSYRAYNLWDGWKWWLPDACTQRQAIQGAEPVAAGQYPVLVYLHGTLADWGGNAEGRRLVAQAAAQGFVAVALSHDSWVVSTLTAVDGNAECMFDAGSNGNALAQICTRPKADCGRGVAVVGFSAGGAIAARAKNFASQVEAAWLMGVNGGSAFPQAALPPPEGTRALSNDALRMAIGRSDVATGQGTIDLTQLNRMTGQSCAASPCLRPDGSGYVVVDDAEVADGVADHCWWQSVNVWVPSNSCTWTPQFDPGFLPPGGAPWSLTANLDWLRAKLG